MNTLPVDLQNIIYRLYYSINYHEVIEEYMKRISGGDDDDAIYFENYREKMEKNEKFKFPCYDSFIFDEDELQEIKNIDVSKDYKLIFNSGLKEYCKKYRHSPILRYYYYDRVDTIEG